MNNIVIPITIRRNVFIKSIGEIINKSGLPYFVIEDVLKDMLTKVHSMADTQLRQDYEQYEESLKKANQNVSEQEAL